MRDFDIRMQMKESILKQYYSDSHSKVIEEFTLPIAKARIDMAVINGHLHGFEIKSASDTLQRLPGQLIAYAKVFDYLTIVTEEKHKDKVLNILPDWVGVSICCERNGVLAIKKVKKGLLNNNKEAFYLAKLLWREELMQVLNENKISFRTKDRNWILAEQVALNFNPKQLSVIVREKLKCRSNWKTEF